MYQLVRTHVRLDRQWLSIEAGNLTIAQLKSSYERIRLYVTGGDGADSLITLETLYPVIPLNDHGLTITSWLQTIDSSYLNTVEEALTLDKVAKMVVRDLWDYPLSVTMGNIDYGQGVAVPLGLATDLVIAPLPDTSTTLLNTLTDYGLFAINGRILKTVRVQDRLIVLDAKRHLLADYNLHHSATVLLFAGIGKLTWVDVTRNNTGPMPTLDHISRVHVTSPVNLASKTVLGIVDGYPHFLDGVVEAWDGHNVIFTLKNKEIALRELKDGVANWTGVGGANVRDSGINLSDVNGYEHLVGGTSAIVVIDNPDVNIHRRPAGRTDIIGLYTYPKPPCGLLLLNDGCVADYRLEGWDGSQASINISGGQHKEYLHHDTHPFKDFPITRSQRQTPQPVAEGGQFIDIYSATA